MYHNSLHCKHQLCYHCRDIARHKMSEHTTFKTHQLYSYSIIIHSQLAMQQDASSYVHLQLSLKVHKINVIGTIIRTSVFCVDKICFLTNIAVLELRKCKHEMSLCKTKPEMNAHCTNALLCCKMDKILKQNCENSCNHDILFKFQQKSNTLIQLDCDSTIVR